MVVFIGPSQKEGSVCLDVLYRIDTFPVVVDLTRLNVKSIVTTNILGIRDKGV